MFALGPCEALIPLMMAPSMTGDWATLAGVVLVFGGVTVTTMLAIVAVGCAGLRLGLGWARPALRHVDAVAGLAIAASGAAVMFFRI